MSQSWQGPPPKHMPKRRPTRKPPITTGFSLYDNTRLDWGYIVVLLLVIGAFGALIFMLGFSAGVRSLG